MNFYPAIKANYYFLVNHCRI